MEENHLDHEALVRHLNDPALRAEYAAPYDRYRAGLIPCALGAILIFFGDLVYGKKPSYGKFKAIEVIARIPYQSWESAAYTLVSLFHGDEKRAVELSKTAAFSRAAQDNETMHVVVISHLAKKAKKTAFVRHLLIPALFAFVYFWILYLLYLASRRASFELNYLFESHAYQQYQRFLEENEAELKSRSLMSDFLQFYGREARSEYEFFEMVRNDELIHRNRSLREIATR
jgi:ubiquinol oxidase